MGALTQIRASGGGVKGALSRQIMVSTLDAERVISDTAEGAA